MHAFICVVDVSFIITISIAQYVHLMYMSAAVAMGKEGFVLSKQ